VEKAQPVLNYRRNLPNGDIIQVAVWLLPDPLPGSSHPFKYRLHYQTADGSDIVRYDNERGKGDHRHVEGKEAPYCFETLKKLMLDFYEAVGQVSKSGGIR
jgi:hypothetical protein